MPKTQDLVIFMPTMTTTTDKLIALLLVHAHRVMKGVQLYYYIALEYHNPT